MSNDSSQGRQVVEYIWEKSSQYRVIKVDGAHGAVSSKGGVSFDLYSEYKTMPTKSFSEIQDDGSLGKETTEGISAFKVTREREVHIQMDYSTAKSLLQWLGSRVEELENMMKIESNE